MKKFIILSVVFFGFLSYLSSQNTDEGNIQSRGEDITKDFLRNFEGKVLNEFLDFESFEFEDADKLQEMSKEWQFDMPELSTEQIEEWKKNFDGFSKEDYAMNVPELWNDFTYNVPKSFNFNAESKDNKELQQNNDELFNKLSDIKGVEVVYVSKALFGMIGSMDIAGMNAGGIDIKDIIGKLESLQVFTAEESNAIKKMKMESDKLIKNGKYETLMFVKDEESKTVFYMNKINNIKSELLMISEEPSEISIIRFIGNFTLRDLQQLTKKDNKKKK